MPLKAAKPKRAKKVWKNSPVEKTVNHLSGECPHKCTYCYVPKSRYPGMKSKYSGAPRLSQPVFKLNLDRWGFVMLGTCNDLFAQTVPDAYIDEILEHCRLYPKTIYRFQTKNPARYLEFLDRLPPKVVLGTTAETNRPTPNVSTAPAPLYRLKALAKIKGIPAAELAALAKAKGVPLPVVANSIERDKFIITRVNIEPVMAFDLREFFLELKATNPSEILIGPDSQHSNLPQPATGEVDLLITAIESNFFPRLSIQVKRKLKSLVSPATMIGRPVIA